MKLKLFLKRFLFACHGWKFFYYHLRIEYKIWKLWNSYFYYDFQIFGSADGEVSSSRSRRMRNVWESYEKNMRKYTRTISQKPKIKMKPFETIISIMVLKTYEKRLWCFFFWYEKRRRGCFQSRFFGRDNKKIYHQ